MPFIAPKIRKQKGYFLLLFKESKTYFTNPHHQKSLKFRIFYIIDKKNQKTL